MPGSGQRMARGVEGSVGSVRSSGRLLWLEECVAATTADMEGHLMCWVGVGRVGARRECVPSLCALCTEPRGADVPGPEQETRLGDGDVGGDERHGVTLV